MQYSHFLGLDVSKATLNYCLIAQGQPLAQGQVKNDTTKVVSLIETLGQRHDFGLDQLLVCCENTGHYTHPLLAIKAKLEVDLWCEDPLQLSRSCGRQRTKTDTYDARMIADYAYRHSDKADLYELPSQALALVCELKGLRSQLVDCKKSLSVSLKERSAFLLYKSTSLSAAERVIQKVLDEFKSAIKALEKQILDAIAEDEKLKGIYELTRSVPGMGPVTAIEVIVTTGCYRKIPTARKAACYAGIAPHRRQSGTSLNQLGRCGKGHVGLKTALHQSCHCLIGSDNLFRDFYRRKREEKQNYLQAINAVRNKLLHVVYSCVQNGRPYDKKVHQGLA